MPESPEESSYRHVLLFRTTRISETPPISIETSLYRSELTGNYIIEQTMIGLNETTTATVVLSAETIEQLIPLFERIVYEHDK